jgi:pyruvate dehydrogenase E1 component subunit alpha
MSEPSRDELISVLRDMLLIRNFETRAEDAYRHGKVGGFMHSYAGQEAIACGAIRALGLENWWSGTYRCHALALLLGVTPEEAMAELFGKATGNAQGRGGSMHFYTDRLLGGFGIVGGQVPVATGAGFSAKYLKTGEISICFLGDGAVPQGAFHESLNLASLWDLPCLYVIENNQWGMGTAASRAVSVEKIAEKHAVAYGIEGLTIDGMDYLTCYNTFKELGEKIRGTGRPILLEAVTERFRGHSISDPALYRSKEQLKEVMQRDPILKLSSHLGLSDEEFKTLDKEQRERVLEAVKFADESPWPDPAQLEEGVLADG